MIPVAGTLPKRRKATLTQVSVRLLLEPLVQPPLVDRGVPQVPEDRLLDGEKAVGERPWADSVAGLSGRGGRKTIAVEGVKPGEARRESSKSCR